MTYFTFQANEKDCGFAALKMLLAKVQKNKDLLYLSKPKWKKENFTFFDLQAIAKEEGVTLASYKYAHKFDIIGQDQIPFLARLNKADGEHLVMINSFKTNKLEIYDPAVGILKVRFDDFLAEWDGYTLEVLHVEKRKYKKPKTTIIPPFLNCLTYAFDLIALTFLLLGFYFLNDTKHLYLPIIFLFAFAVTELLEKSYVFYILKYFDKKYLPKLCSLNDDEFPRRYREYIEFKKNYFSLGKNFFFSLLTTLSITWILIINDYRHLYFIFLFLAIALLEHFFLDKKKNINEYYLARFESRLMDHLLTSEERLKTIMTLNTKTYQYVFDLSIRKFLYLLLLILTSLFLMIFNNLFSANYVLLNFFIYYFLIENLRSILRFNYEKRKSAYLYAKFADVYLC